MLLRQQSFSGSLLPAFRAAVSRHSCDCWCQKGGSWALVLARHILSEHCFFFCCEGFSSIPTVHKPFESETEGQGKTISSENHTTASLFIPNCTADFSFAPALRIYTVSLACLELGFLGQLQFSITFWHPTPPTWKEYASVFFCYFIIFFIFSFWDLSRLKGDNNLSVAKAISLVLNTHFRLSQ